MKKIIVIIMVLCFANVFSQSISPQVINSAGGGGTVGSTGVEVYYNIGEPLVSTIGNGTDVITQGFLQPDIVGKFGLTVTMFSTNVSCADKTDGTIGVLATIGGVTNTSAYDISYYWSPDTICQGAANTCSLVSNLAAGNYSLMVVSHYIGGGATIPNDTVRIKNIVINGNSEPCIINVYNGISPNGDGNNDFFYINNIDQFPDNNVQVYNRWGQKLFETDHYDNVSNVWRGTAKSSDQVAPAGTYFYIVDLKNGSKPIKGWLELTNSK
jgi:gliding motility-associated-like protein